MDEAVLFSVKIDQTEAIKQTALLSQEISDLVAMQAELDKAGEKNSETYAENAALIRSLKKEQSDVNRAIDNSVKSFNAANGSINQQRANLSSLTQQYNALSKEERENEQVGGKLQKQIKGLSDELKKNEGAVGDNRRSVGSYEQAILGASKTLNLFGVDIGAVYENLKEAKKGIDLTKTGLSSFGGLIKASGIGLLVTLVGGLIAAFTKFDPLMEKLSATFAGLNAIVDVFIERMIRIGQGLVEIASGNFSEGIDMVRNSFDGMGASMATAAGEAYNLSLAMADLEDTMRAQIVLNAEASKQVDKLILQSKNRSLSDKQRIALLDQAAKIERANFEQNKKIKEDEYNLALRNAKIGTQLSEQEIEQLVLNQGKQEELNKRRGKLSDEVLQSLAEKKAAIINTESETINVEEKIANRRSALMESIAADNKKAVEQRIKAAEELQKAFDKLLSDFDAKSKEETQNYYNDLAKRRAKDLQETETYFNEKQTALVDAYAAGTITTEQYEDSLSNLQLERLEKQKAMQVKNFEDTSAITLQMSQFKLSVEEKEAAKLKNINDAKKASYEELAQTAVGAFNMLAQSFAEGSDLQRAAALTGIAVNLATSLGNIMTTSSAPSPDNLATGGISGIVKYGVLLTQVLSAFAQANSILDGAAAGGGSFYTNGPTMLLVGDNPNGREKITVEPIESRGKTSISRNSNLVKMAGGGTLFTDGGAAVNAMTNQVNSMFDMEQLLRNLPTPEVKVSEINRVNSNLSKSVKVSELK